MSYGVLANPPVTLLPIFSEASFDYSTSSTSTIDTELLQAQTDAVNTAATAQNVVLTNIGVILNASSASGSGTIGTNSTYVSSVILELGSYYAVSVVFNFNQTSNLYALNALTLQDNFGNIYDAGKGATGTSVKSCSILFNKILTGNGSLLSFTIYSQATTNGGAYTYSIQTNIVKIK